MSLALWSAVGGGVLKVSEQGHALLAELGAGGRLLERRADSLGERWAGTWAAAGGALTIQVGSHALRVPGGSHLGVETSGAAPTPPSRFFVAPVIRAPGEARERGLVPALVKLPARGGALCAELRVDGVREYDVRVGWAADRWAGTWQGDPTGLSVTIGRYRWSGVARSEPGWFDGRERQPDGEEVPVPGVLVAVDPEQLRDGLRGVPPDGPPLFGHAGYTFHPFPGAPRGYFATVLEARKPSVTGATVRFAARCLRRAPGLRETALREMEIARSFSATDGLIAVFEDFELPDTEAFGAFRGCVVQILELGETDLEHHVRELGPMSVADTLAVARDLSSALAALHVKYRYVHADLRPANVIGRRTGPVLSWRLSDFNCTTRMDDDGRAPVLATSGICVPPEAADRFAQLGLRASRIGPEYDVWSLGVLLLQCATGVVLPQDEPVTARAAQAAAAGLDGTLAAVVGGCLAPVRERWPAEEVHRVVVAAAH